MVMAFKFTLFRLYLKTVALLVTFCLFIVFLLKIFVRQSKENPYLPKIEAQIYPNITLPSILSITELKVKWIERKIERLSGGLEKFDVRTKFSNAETVEKVNLNIHAFYYTWFRNEAEDGMFAHWFLDEKPSSSPEVKTAYYPELGFYSSRNTTVVDIHMNQMQKAGIGVAIVSWFPSSAQDFIMKTLLDSAAMHTMKIALHFRPNRKKGLDMMLKDLDAFLKRFGEHKALFKYKKGNNYLPVVYLFDPYTINSEVWGEILSSKPNRPVRKHPGFIFIGLLSRAADRMEVKKAHFDGFYTYFAANGFSYGSSWRNWKSLAKFASDNKLLFVPCVAPGASEGTHSSFYRPRLDGNYYEIAWKTALSANPSFIAINSFNAWEEGSQIEPAIPKMTTWSKFSDYEKLNPRYYLDFTAFWVKYASDHWKS